MQNVTITNVVHLQDATPSTVRRVYNLPTDLHERLTRYMSEHGISTEVEAVRRLISEELKNYETPDQLYTRLAAMRVDEALIDACGHPQVEAFKWSTNRDEAAIFFRNGRVLRFRGDTADDEQLVRAL
ncbi:hypothetical protein WKW50_05440 [Ochrobactrum sp. GPK 3]